jgi:hypothetical protein
LLAAADGGWQKKRLKKCPIFCIRKKITLRSKKPTF